MLSIISCPNKEISAEMTMACELKRRGSMPATCPFQYAILECPTDEAYSLGRFTISGLTEWQLDSLQATFDLGQVVDSYGYHYPYIVAKRGTEVLPVTAILNHLSRKFGFYVKQSYILQQHGSSFKERYVLERQGP